MRNSLTHVNEIVNYAAYVMHIAAKPNVCSFAVTAERAKG